jgi:WD40 repeat protein
VVKIENQKNEFHFKDSKSVCELELSAVFLAGNTLILWNSFKPKIQVWDPRRCKLTSTLLFPDNSGPLVFSPDSQTIVAGSSQNVWNVSNGLYRFSFQNDSNSVFTPDGHKIISCDDHYDIDGLVIINIRDAYTGKILYSFKSIHSDCPNLAVSPDGRTVALVAEHTTEMWDLVTLQQINFFYDRAGAFFCPDNQNIASRTNKNSVIFWNLETYETFQEIPLPNGFGEINISPDCDTLVGSGENDQIYAWDVKTGSLTKTLTGFSVSKNAISSNNSLIFSPDGKILASLGEDNWYSKGAAAIRIWDVEKGTLLRQEFLDFPIGDLAFSPDGRLLAMTTSDGTICIWGVRKP